MTILFRHLTSDLSVASRKAACMVWAQACTRLPTLNPQLGHMYSGPGPPQSQGASSPLLPSSRAYWPENSSSWKLSEINSLDCSGGS